MTKSIRRTKGCGGITLRKDGRFEVSLPPEITGGARKRVYAKTRKEAEAKLREARDNFVKGVNPAAKKMSVKEYMEHHFAQVIVRERAPETQVSYRRSMDLYIFPALGNVELSKLSVSQVRSFIHSLSDNGLKPNSIRIIHAALRAALNAAMRDELIFRNVAALVQPPSVKRENRAFIEENEAKAIIEAASGHRLGLAIKLDLMTGLRKGELLGLQWRNVNLETGMIQVEQQLQRVKNESGSALKLTKLKTSKSVRSVFIYPKLLDELRIHKAGQRMDFSLMNLPWSEDVHVFSSETGTAIEPRNFNKAFNAVLARAGVEVHYRVHDLRHGAASLLLHYGESLKVVQEILGHSQFSLTADTYSHVLTRSKQDAAAKFGRLY